VAEGVYGEFLFDSSVVLAQVFGNSRFQSRVSKLETDCKRLSIPYFVTPFVSGECMKKANYFGKYVVETVRYLNKQIVEHKDPSKHDQNVQLTENDLPLFMTYFARATGALAGKGAPETQKEALEYIETWIITIFEDELTNSPARSITARDLFVKCIREANNMHSNWVSRLSSKIAKPVPVTLSSRDFLRLQTSLSCVENHDDIRVIGEAIEHCKTNPKVVLVTLDYRDIIKNSEIIEKSTGLRVADPLYALNALRTL
jgi:hypothetical protein